MEARLHTTLAKSVFNQGFILNIYAIDDFVQLACNKPKFSQSLGKYNGSMRRISKRYNIRD